MKKSVIILLIVILVSIAASITVLAYGGYGKEKRTLKQSVYMLCEVENGDAWYCGPSDWQGTYDICSVEGCVLTGLHEHDGAYYYCAYYGTGRGCGGCGNR